MEKEFTVKEVSGMLGVNEETVRRWNRTGRLGTKKDSGNITISAEDLIKFIENNKKLLTPLATTMLAPYGIMSAMGGALLGAFAPIAGLVAGPVEYLAWKKALNDADPKNRRIVLEKEEAKLYQHLAELKTQIAKLNEEVQQCHEQVDEIRKEITKL